MGGGNSPHPLMYASWHVLQAGNPPPQPDKVGAVTKCRARTGNTLEICLSVPNSSYFISSCSFCNPSGKQAEGRRLIKHPFKKSLYFMLGLLHSCCWGLWHERHVILCLFLPSRRVQTNHWKKKLLQKNIIVGLILWRFVLLWHASLWSLWETKKKSVFLRFECLSWKWSIRYCLWHENCPSQDSEYHCLCLNRLSMANSAEPLL